MKELDEHRVPIPDCYKWMAKGNKRLYLDYIRGYLRISHPKLKPVRVEKSDVICVKK